MHAFQLLKADHEKVAALFDRLEAASGKAKITVFEQIKTELELHTHIEEKIFYPALEKPSKTHDLILEAYEEHDGVKKLLSQLSGKRTANDEWQAKAKVLRENVEHHVEEEENELFNKAGDVLNDEEFEALGQRMATEKERRQGRAGARTSARKSTKKTSKKSAPAKKGTKKSASKAAKKSGGKKASKSASRSTASKTAKRSRTRKSTAKKK